MTGQLLVVAPNGAQRLEPLQQDENGETLRQLYRLIGCRWVEMVGLSADLDMWLDEEGALTKQPVNRYAWRIAQHLFYPLPCGPYVGVAVFARHDAEGDMVGLTDDRITWLQGFLDPASRPAGAR